jgi:hypothetical protein
LSGTFTKSLSVHIQYQEGLTFTGWALLLLVCPIQLANMLLWLLHCFLKIYIIFWTFKVLTFQKIIICRNDSRVFVLELLKSYDGQTHLYFKEVLLCAKCTKTSYYTLIFFYLSSSIFKIMIIWLGHIVYIFGLADKMFSKFVCHAGAYKVYLWGIDILFVHS